MYVKKNSCKNGRILLTLTHGYRENGKIHQKNVETLGYLDDLEKLYDDPIAHFREIANRLVGVHTEEEGDGLGHGGFQRSGAEGAEERGGKAG